VQNAASRLFVGARRYNKISVDDIMMHDLHWLRVRERIDYKLCMTLFNCLHGTAPMYLSCGISNATAARRGLRSEAFQLGKIAVPDTLTKTFGTRALCISGPTAWNN
jgi:hypothetical protein